MAATTWKGFSETTTLHGVQFINSASSWVRRSLWTLFVLTGFVFFIYQCYKTMTAFFDYKAITVVSVTNDYETNFPAITICNHNTLLKSKVEANHDDLAVQQLMIQGYEYLHPEGKSINKSKTSNRIITGQELKDIYLKYGHTMDNITSGGMLVSCATPTGEICTEKDFHRTLTFSGLCYTLNSGRGKGVTIHSTLSGRFAAVKVILSAQVDEYSTAIGRQSSTGISVHIHDQRDPPVADTHGMYVGPGTAASIAVKKHKFLSLKHPYKTKCSDEELAPGQPYSRNGCIRKCKENYVIKMCNCTLPLETIIDPKNVQPCDLGATLMCATPKVTDDFNKHKVKCNCPFACESVDYMATISYAQYPSDIDARQVSIKDLSNEGKAVTEEAITNKTIELRKNRIQLEIFYHQMDYLTTEAVPASTPVQLFAEIGGLLGIALGASFLTILEIAEFVVVVIKHKILKRKEGRVACIKK